MTALDLMQNLELRGIRLSIDGNHLAVDGPDPALTPDVINSLREHKGELMTMLSSKLTVTDSRSFTAQPNNACPNCCDVLDLQHRTPEVWWCAGCRRWVVNGSLQ
jgi:hypothetical protein